MRQEIRGELPEQTRGVTSGYFRPAFFSLSLGGTEGNHPKNPNSFCILGIFLL